MKYYSEKLKDPRWQKKRLQILNRDQFKCRFCSDDKTELHVHHLKYKCNPWDAHDEDLVTLCEKCHYVVERSKINPKTSVCEIIEHIGIGYRVYTVYGKRGSWFLLYGDDEPLEYAATFTTEHVSALYKLLEKEGK